jgi:hypothetical protein
VFTFPLCRIRPANSTSADEEAESGAEQCGAALARGTSLTMMWVATVEYPMGQKGSKYHMT